MAKAIQAPTVLPLARHIVRMAIPGILISSCGIIALQPELRLAIPLLIGATASMSALLAFVLYWGERTEALWSTWVILAVALLLRIMFLFSPPQLSDDIYRYLWDGSNTLSRINPYATPPSVVTPPPDLKHVHAMINHPDYFTIYPPAAQLVFAGGAALGGSITGLKAFLVLLDLGMCAMLVMLLKQLELPFGRAVLYAWNPLPVLEIAASGHVDGAGLAMLLGSFCLLVWDRQSNSLRRWSFLLSGALLGCAGLVKLFPLVLAPILFLLVPVGRRRYFSAGFVVSLFALAQPFLPHLVNITASLNAYARNWEFAGFAFNTLRTITGSGTVARLLVSCCFVAAAGFIACRFNLRCKKSPSSTAILRQAVAACYATSMAFLLLTPTLQPWYALCLALFLPFCAGPAGLVLCWAVFLTYQVQIPYFILGKWIENGPVTTAVFLTPVTVHLLTRLVPPSLPPPLNRGD